MTPDVAAVRQNLHLIVKDGMPASGITTNRDALFGSGKNQFQYTWRSGVGTTASGDLVYVAGKSLTLSTLASAMVRAHIQTGMELDIHTRQVSFTYFPTPGGAETGDGQRLLRSMTTPTDRYLNPDQRDFFYVTAR